MPTPLLRQIADLVREHGPFTSRQLAEREGCAHSTAAMRLDRAERAGLVVRRFAPEGTASRYEFSAT